MDAAELTQEFLKNVLDFDPETGNFVWKQRFGKRGIPGRIAGGLDFNGYWVITINKKRHKGHRLAWLYVHGRWPAVAVDHINGDRGDNRMVNLREATNSENQHNRRLQVNNKTGYMGVCWDAKAQRFRAVIRAHGRSRDLGSYACSLEAHRAYLEAKAKLHPFQPVPRDA